MNIDNLSPGDHHFTAYVGPPTQYDFMGATQFRLLCTLGLRSSHSLLDFGCGSLRAGRLFISYLDPEKYFGIEPNKWLIEDAIENQIGADQINIKNPSFDYNSDFSATVFSAQFDFILAQSIFSHTGIDLTCRLLHSFKKALKDDGIIVATFVKGFKSFDGLGWVYPECVKYNFLTIQKFAKDSGLFAKRIPWYHPRQSWYVLAKHRKFLPCYSATRHLTGAVLFDQELAESWRINRKIFNRLKASLINNLPPAIKNQLKTWFLKTNK